MTNNKLETSTKLAEANVCPVWAMLKGNVEIAVKCQVKSEG